MTRSTLSPLFTWRGAIGDSGLPPTVRHVLLAVSLYMSERGDSAFPGNARLVHDTGLGDRAVRRALKAAVEADWLVVKVKGCSNKGGRRIASVYAANVPDCGPSDPSDPGLTDPGLTDPGLRSPTTAVPESADPGRRDRPCVIKAPAKASSLSDDTVRSALTIIADRRVERAKGLKRPIVNYRAYRRRVLADATEELTDELTKRAVGNPAWSASDLAEMFEPSRSSLLPAGMG